MKKPSYLIPPCGKSRKDITAWLENFGPHRGGRDYEDRPFDVYSSGPWLFCFNVKTYIVDFSFEHLLKLHFEKPGTISLRQRQAYKDRYDEMQSTNPNDLWERAVDVARNTFIGRDGAPDDDAYNMNWQGEKLETRFSFMGRSGGWLVMTGFEGHILNTDLDLNALTFKQLRNLAEMLWFVAQAVKGRKAELETNAAFEFFENIAADVPNDKQQAEAWATDQTGEH